MSNVRLGIWDPTGLWGSRVTRAASSLSTAEIRFSVYRAGGPLTLALRRLQCAPACDSLFPGRCFLQGTAAELDSYNRQAAGRVGFLPLSELQYRDTADMILDMTSDGDGGGGDDYQRFRGPVVWQHTVRNRGVLIAPPFVARKDGANRFRQSACIVSGVLPVIDALSEGLSGVSLQVLMQVDEKSTDFLIPERLNSVRFVTAYATRLEGELSAILPGVAFRVPSVLQVPGLSNYMVTMVLETREELSGDEILSRMARAPHVSLIPPEIDATYALSLIRSLDFKLPPTAVFESSIKVEKSARGTTVTMIASLDYRILAVVPFIDAVHIFGGKHEPRAAMQETDRALGYCA